MTRQKITFFLIVGSAVILVIVASALHGWPGEPSGLPSRGTAEPTAEGTPSPEALVTEILSGKRTWNGLQIGVISVEEDGWPLVKAQNPYNEPPAPGKRMLLVTVQVEKAEDADDQPVSVGAQDFKVVGERGVVYTTYGKETRCGVVPDELDGVVTPDHPISGAICVQVPEDEKDLVLVYEPYVGDKPAVYIPLPPGK